jgi:hypothetical protein
MREDELGGIEDERVKAMIGSAQPAAGGRAVA